MCVLFTGLFWGVLLLLIGLSVILKAVFHIDFPVLRLAFGLFLIFLGLQLVLGRSLGCGGRPHAFAESRIAQPQAEGKYEVLFGKGELDLGGLVWEGKDASFTSNTVFGSTKIKIPAKLPVLIRASAAFAGAKFPDGNLVSFGEYAYKSKAYKEGKPCLRLKASVVFGELNVEE